MTGGAQGIGRGIVRQLLRAGAVAVIGDIDETAMEASQRELAPLGVVDRVRLDVSDPESCRAGLDELVAPACAVPPRMCSWSAGNTGPSTSS